MVRVYEFQLFLFCILKFRRDVLSIELIQDKGSVVAYNGCGVNF